MTNYAWIQMTRPDGRMIDPLDAHALRDVFAVVVYEGEMETPDSPDNLRSFNVLSRIMTRHNVDRPMGHKVRSMSVGDVVVLQPEQGDPEVWVVSPVGFAWIPVGSGETGSGGGQDFGSALAWMAGVGVPANRMLWPNEDYRAGIDWKS